MSLSQTRRVGTFKIRPAGAALKHLNNNNEVQNLKEILVESRTCSQREALGSQEKALATVGPRDLRGREERLLQVADM